MNSLRTRCLILGCGNTLRSDDGAAPWLCAWAADWYAAEPAVRIIARQQWTPDLAQDIASADSVLFIDCSVESEPGQVRLRPIRPATREAGLATHHTDAAHLLSLAYELFGSAPGKALLLTIGAGSVELGEEFSPAVQSSLPLACKSLEDAVQMLINVP